MEDRDWEIWFTALTPAGRHKAFPMAAWERWQWPGKDRGPAQDRGMCSPVPKKPALCLRCIRKVRATPPTVPVFVGSVHCRGRCFRFDMDRFMMGCDYDRIFGDLRRHLCIREVSVAGRAVPVSDVAVLCAGWRFRLCEDRNGA